MCVYQVIICTKEVSVGARKNAYSLLVEIGNAFNRFHGNAKGNTLQHKYVQSIVIHVFYSAFPIQFIFSLALFSPFPPTISFCLSQSPSPPYSLSLYPPLFIPLPLPSLLLSLPPPFPLSEALQQYLLMVYVGLTGSVTMITCTVLALTRLVFQFKGQCTCVWVLAYLVSGKDKSSEEFCFSICVCLTTCVCIHPDSIDVSTMEELLHNVCMLLRSRTREIVKASLSFIKVILFILDPKTLASHATAMVGLTLSHTHTHTHRWYYICLSPSRSAPASSLS